MQATQKYIYWVKQHIKPYTLTDHLFWNGDIHLFCDEDIAVDWTVARRKGGLFIVFGSAFVGLNGSRFFFFARKEGYFIIFGKPTRIILLF